MKQLIIGFMLAAFAGNLFASKFIVDGTPATLKEFPWQVSLQTKEGSHFCGGVIIDQRHILTAGHCLIIKDFVVKAGGDGTKKNLKDLGPIEKKVQHENYLVTKKLNDIAMIVLTNDIEFSETIKPIKIADPDSYVIGQKAIITGWGYTINPHMASGTDALPEVLRQTTIDLAPRFTDSEYWRNSFENPYIFDSGRYEEYKESVFADTYKDWRKGRGACNGDSGGPLVTKNSRNEYELRGLVSMAVLSCGRSTIFTDVPYHLDWIQKNY